MIKRLIVIVALLSTVLTNAQENISSPYSYYGIGLTKFKGTVENRSMGGLSVFSDSIHINLRNPAGYGRLKLTNYSVGASHQITNTQNATESENNKMTSLEYLAIGIPTGKFGFGLGLMPYSSVGYRILSRNDEVATRLNGRGGMNKVFLSAGYEMSNELSLGVDAHYNFGNIQNRRTVLREGIQLGTRDIKRSDISGFSYNLGLDFQKRVFNNLRLHASATYSPKVDLTAENYRELSTIGFLQGQEAVINQKLADVEDSDFELPSQYTIGAGLGRQNEWFIGGEYSNVGSSSYLENFSSGNNAFYEDAAQYRLGGYYIPEYNSLTSYISRVVYRAGLRFEETGLNINNHHINEFGISFGIGLPVGANFSNANLGIEYGQRGTTDSNLIQENFFRISIGLSLNDKWFERRRFN